LSEEDGVEFMPELAGSYGNRWLSTITFKNTNPLDVMNALNKIDVESRPLWKPMHLQPLFSDAKTMLNGTSDELYKKGLCLASSTTMKKEDVVEITDEIKKVLKGN
jgi:UDP-N-acetylbacillosamine transaminase